MKYAALLPLLFISHFAFAISPEECSARLDFEANKTAIKQEVRKIWERKKVFGKYTQAQVARALGISQSAFSKLLTDDSAHPWTLPKLQKFAEFIGSSLVELLPEELIPLPPDEESGTGLRADIKWAMELHFLNRGYRVTKQQVERLSSRPIRRLQGTRPTKEQIEAAVEEGILSAAFGEF